MQLMNARYILKDPNNNKNTKSSKEEIKNKLNEARNFLLEGIFFAVISAIMIPTFPESLPYLAICFIVSVHFFRLSYKNYRHYFLLKEALYGALLQIDERGILLRKETASTLVKWYQIKNVKVEIPENNKNSAILYIIKENGKGIIFDMKGHSVNRKLLMDTMNNYLRSEQVLVERENNRLKMTEFNHDVQQLIHKDSGKELVITSRDINKSKFKEDLLSLYVFILLEAIAVWGLFSYTQIWLSLVSFGSGVFFLVHFIKQYKNYRKSKNAPFRKIFVIDDEGIFTDNDEKTIDGVIVSLVKWSDIERVEIKPGYRILHLSYPILCILRRNGREICIDMRYYPIKQKELKGILRNFMNDIYIDFDNWMD